VISIIAGPFAVSAADAWLERRAARVPAVLPSPTEPAPPPRLGHRAIVAGYTDIGRIVARVLGVRFDVLVVDQDARRVALATGDGLEALEGSPSSETVLDRMGMRDARLLVVALDDPFETRLLTERASALNPHAEILSVAGSASQADRLRISGASDAIVATEEVALELARRGLRRFGLSSREALAIVQRYRADSRLP
jgi:CPA2 family monovalent cation:H+ antiporter-2